MSAAPPPGIDEKRFLDRFEALSAVGSFGGTGVNRQALSQCDLESHRLVLGWFDRPDYTASADKVGNVFITRRGGEEGAPPVMLGSHLDSQPSGGRFDGALGVLAAAEVMASLDDRGITTVRPVQMAIWMNEEGCRFAPVTMGSSVYAGKLQPEQTFASTSPDGSHFGEELSKFVRALALESAGEPALPAAYIELHIEQGPVLESGNCDIGIVTGVQGVRQYQVNIRGQEAHAGTTPVSMRRDAFAAARRIIGRLEQSASDEQDLTRFTVGRCNVLPSAPNTVPGSADFTIDLRHPNEVDLDRIEALVHEACREFAPPCEAQATRLIAMEPVVFDAFVSREVEISADAAGLCSRRLLSGATHDAANMASVCPSAMIFIPCRNGVSHHPDEYASAHQMIAGANTLYRTALSLAGENGAAMTEPNQGRQ